MLCLCSSTHGKRTGRMSSRLGRLAVLSPQRLSTMKLGADGRATRKIETVTRIWGTVRIMLEVYA